jgi:hypothetical protein
MALISVTLNHACEHAGLALSPSVVKGYLFHLFARVSSSMQRDDCTELHQLCKKIYLQLYIRNNTNYYV